MSFKVRNSIVLGGLWLLITVTGLVFWQWWQPRTLDKLKAELDLVTKELDDLPGLTDEVQRLTAAFQDVKRKYDSRSKEIPQSDVSSQTYGYMSRGIDAAGFLKFDMKFLGTNEKQSWGYNAYQLLQGEAQFSNLYRFVHFLENGRRLYKIASMKIDLREALDVETRETTKFIEFGMELHAYFVKNVPELGTSLAAKSLATVQAPANPFNPIILTLLSPEAPMGEINADNTQVRAVLPGKAFLLVENELRVVHLGDKVWRGHISRIDPSQSSVEFTLNEGGVIRKLKKTIQFDRRTRLP